MKGIDNDLNKNNRIYKRVNIELTINGLKLFTRGYRGGLAETRQHFLLKALNLTDTEGGGQRLTQSSLERQKFYKQFKVYTNIRYIYI